MSGPRPRHRPMDADQRHQLLQDCLERIEQGEPPRTVLAGIEDPELRAILDAQIAMADALRAAPLPVLPPADAAVIEGHLQRIEMAKGGPWNGGNGSGLGASTGFWSLMAGGLLIGAWLLARLIGGGLVAPVAEDPGPPTPVILQAVAPTIEAPATDPTEAAYSLPESAGESEIEDLLARLIGTASAGPDLTVVAAETVTRPPPASATATQTRTPSPPRRSGGSTDERPSRTSTSISMPSATWTLIPTSSATPTPSATASSTLVPPKDEPSKTPTAHEVSPTPSPTSEETGFARLSVRVEQREGEARLAEAKVLVYVDEGDVAFDAKTDGEGVVRFELRPDTKYWVYAEREDHYGRYWEDAEEFGNANAIELDAGAEKDIRIRLNPRVPPLSPPVSIAAWGSGS